MKRRGGVVPSCMLSIQLMQETFLVLRLSLQNVREVTTLVTFLSPTKIEAGVRGTLLPFMIDAGARGTVFPFNGAGTLINPPTYTRVSNQ